MTTLTELRALAEAVIVNKLSDHALFSPTRVGAHDAAVVALTDAIADGTVVLAMIECIEAAKAMRRHMPKGSFERTPEVSACDAFDAALAKLEQGSEPTMPKIELTDEKRKPLLDQVKETLPYQLGYGDGLAAGIEGSAKACEYVDKMIDNGLKLKRGDHAAAVRALLK